MIDLDDYDDIKEEIEQLRKDFDVWLKTKPSKKEIEQISDGIELIIEELYKLQDTLNVDDGI